MENTKNYLAPVSGLGHFAIRHSKAIAFIAIALCFAGAYTARTMPSSVFPRTDFPRIVVDIDNGVMPANEMMATITRPVEEVMKDVPGVIQIRSATSRGTAQIDVFFDWATDMQQAELFVNTKISQARNNLPATTGFDIHRLTFSSFPIAGFSLTSKTRNLESLWEFAQYRIKPQFLRTSGVARVNILGGREPEFHVVVDPIRMQAAHLSLPQIADVLSKTNTIQSAGLNEEHHKLYLTLVNGRVEKPSEIENICIASQDGHPVFIKDIANVVPGAKPVFNIVTAGGTNAVLLNIYSQSTGNTLQIADELNAEIKKLKAELPPDLKLSVFYDQSLLVRSSVRGVWEAIYFGLILSVIIIYLFLRNWGSTIVAIVVIPITILVTVCGMKYAGMSFNLMTLGGIAAAIGLVIDDAIVMVEAIYARMLVEQDRKKAVEQAVSEIFMPLVGSTLTPVVVFIPTIFLDGVPGVFFRALALTMVVALLTSLILAITLTPALAIYFMRVKSTADENLDQHSWFMRRVINFYEYSVRTILIYPKLGMGACALSVMGAVMVYFMLASDFLPAMDEGGFTIDYVAPTGTSLSETNRELLDVEKVLTAIPEIESYSRRTGTALGFEVVEPNKGDYLIKLRTNRTRTTQEVIADARAKLKASQPEIDWEFPGILADLIGDMTVSPQPIEIKVFSPDINVVKNNVIDVEKEVHGIHGIVDVKNGIVEMGPTFSVNVKSEIIQKMGLTTDDVARALNTAMLGQTASWVLDSDHIVNLRVRFDSTHTNQLESLRSFPLTTPNGNTVLLSQVADILEKSGDIELHREDQRQYLAVTARLEGRDLGGAMDEIKRKLGKSSTLNDATIEYAGLYKEQQKSFYDLLLVLIMAIILVFTVLLLEFRSYRAPISILFGAVLALTGSVFALYLSDISLNIISFLGAIIGVGIVAKNGILLLDNVERLRLEGHTLEESLVRSGSRRLRPVLMTSFAAALGMLPLAFGSGTGAEMLKPLGVAVIGSLCISVMLSLIATPAAYYILHSSIRKAS